MKDYETKELVKGFVRWLIIILLVLNALVYWGIISAHCQEVKPTPKVEEIHAYKHKDKVQQEDEIRMMSVTVTEKNGDLVYLYRENKKVVEITFLFWDKNSVIKDKDVIPTYQFKGCYLMLYCLEHRYIYWLQREACSPNRGGFYFTDK